MDRHPRVIPPRQETFEFARRGPEIPKAIHRECRALLVQLLLDVVRVESENDGSGESS